MSELISAAMSQLRSTLRQVLLIHLIYTSLSIIIKGEPSSQ
jgi:hypothetical protein